MKTQTYKLGDIDGSAMQELLSARQEKNVLIMTRLILSGVFVAVGFLIFGFGGKDWCGWGATAWGVVQEYLAWKAGKDIK